MYPSFEIMLCNQASAKCIKIHYIYSEKHKVLDSLTGITRHTKKNFLLAKGLFTWKEASLVNHNQAVLGKLAFHMFLVKMHWSASMLDRVTCHPGETLLTCPVYPPRRAILLPCEQFTTGYPTSKAEKSFQCSLPLIPGGDSHQGGYSSGPGCSKAD